MRAINQTKIVKNVIKFTCVEAFVKVPLYAG
jgi:hypothetical protein